MKKRLLSLALCLALCLGLLPVGVLAADGSGVYEGTGDPEAASVISVNGTTTNYATLPEALNAARDGDTVKLLANHTTDWDAVYASEEQMAVVKTRITLDLNGNTVDYLVVGEVVPDEAGGILESFNGNLTVQSSQSGGTAMEGQITTLKFVKGTLAVQDGVIIGSSSSSTGLICEADSGTVTISGGIVYNAKVGKGAAVTVSGGSMHQGQWINNGTLNITGGTFGWVKFYNNSGTIAISGGTFGSLQNLDNDSSQIAPMSLLAPGHAFYERYNENTVKDGSSRDFLQDVTVKEHTHTMVINKCACGYTCPHTSVDANGACTVCHKQIAASVTAGEDVTYYDGLGKALNYANQNKGCTLKLLANVESAVSVEAPLIFDLNGHNVQRLSVCAKATIRDSGTEKGKIGKVLIFDKEGEKPSLTLGDLLEEGYAFKYENDTWVNDSHVQTTEGSFVTVEKAPIQSVNVYAKDKNNQEILTIAYGATGEVTLVSSCNLSETSGENLSCAWYKLTDDTAIPPLEGAAGTSYKLPADLPAGTYTYRVTFTSDYYSKSAEITITVTPISLEGAEVTVQNPTYNGNEQGPEVTVKLGDKTLGKDNDYNMKVTKHIYAGSYQLTINGGGNYTGTKTVEWKILPKTVENPTIEVSSVTYNGQAQTPSVTVKDGDTIIPDTQYTVSYQNNTNAGTATVIVVSTSNSNYKFGPTEQAFTITKADAPTVTTGKLTVVNNHEGTYTYDLKQLLPTAPNGTYGNIDWNGGYQHSFSSQLSYVKNYTIDNDGILTIISHDNNLTTTGKVGTITITVKTDNYEDISLPIDVFAENKTLPELDGSVSLSKTAITFGESLDNITISGTMKDGNNTVEGTFSWPTSKELYPAGTHEVEWIFTPTNSGKYAVATGKVTITVNKATPTGAPKYTAITTSGKTLKDAGLTVNENWPEGSIHWVDANGTEMDVDTAVSANTAYTWKFVPTDTDNYNDLTGTITLWHKSSSSSSSGAVTPGTKTDTVKNPDGSTTKTETKADGSKTETTTASSGGGSTGITVTKTDAKGNTTTEASAKLSDRDVKEAQEKGEAVTVPVKGIAAAKDANAATKIKIDVPNNANKTTVEIPVENVTSGTVAVIVHEDGTEELVKDSKPTEHGVQLELSGSTTVKIIDNSKTFDDTKDHWSRDEVNFVAARELFNGVGGNQFGVSQPMTRGMVNTVLARLADVDTTPSQGQAWYEVGTDWAKKNGISDGTNPTAPVTREQLATLLYRYAGSPSVSGTLHAADAASVSDYAEDALLWANQNGIVNGVGSNTIAPKDNAQRAQVAAMLARYLQNQ